MVVFASLSIETYKILEEFFAWSCLVELVQLDFWLKVQFISPM